MWWQKWLQLCIFLKFVMSTTAYLGQTMSDCTQTAGDFESREFSNMQAQSVWVLFIFFWGGG